MKLLSLTCQHCAAPLEVPVKTTQFKCLYCGSRLHVQWTASVAHTEALEVAARQISHLIKSPEQLRIEEEIDLLDDAWKTVRQRFLFRDVDGQLRVPDKNTIQLVGIFGVLLGVGAIVMATTSGFAYRNLYSASPWA